MQIQSKYNPYNHQNDQHYLVQHDKKMKCICELCTCGKHHCPRKPIKNDFQTSYSREYRKFNNFIPAGQRPPYRYEDRHYSPEVLKTNYQENFEKQISFVQQPPLSNSRFQQVGKKILAPQVPFSGVSSYKQQYQPYKMIEPFPNQNPQLDYLGSAKMINRTYKPTVKFEGISSYKSAFLTPPQNKIVNSKENNYKKPQAPFYGVSSYKQQYRPVEMIPHKEFYEANPYKNIPQAKFEGHSSYKDQFKPYEVEKINSYSRISNKNSQCKLDEVILPSVNYINNEDHVYYDPQLKKFC